MLKHVPITIVSDDKPGLVEKIARCIKQHQGNWLESNLSKLSGKFAGVILIELPHDQHEVLRAALVAIKSEGIYAYLHDATHTPQIASESPSLAFHASGPDQKGIVQELTELFSAMSINVQSLRTECTSMPYSGNPLFEAHGVIEPPQKLDQDELQKKLHEIGDRLALDIILTE